MRRTITRTVESLQPPSAAERAVATSAKGREAHARFMEAWPALATIEHVDAPVPPALPSRVRVGAWNLERGKRIPETVEVLQREGVDVLLATEMDRGMARSGQVHTTAAIAEALGFGHVYGVEFVELGLGDSWETDTCAGQSNLHGLHGNAILSRWPLTQPAVFPLDDGGRWYVTSPKGDGQRRVGGRMAIAAQIETAAGPLTVVSVHYESESTAPGRSEQTERMLGQLSRRYGEGPTVIGGDLNTALLEAGTDLRQPEALEPAFERFAAAGFGWHASNAFQTTTRRPAHVRTDRPHRLLDWLLVRGVEAEAPRVVPATDVGGGYISDHELVVADLTL